MKSKRTVRDIRLMKESGRKIAMLTAYDASMASLLDQGDVDVLLVGDSLGMVVLGLDSTVPVTMDQMIHHCRAVSRGISTALLVGDMPFGSYQESISATIGNGVRFLKEGRCDAVKLEGGEEVCEQVHALVRAGVPVMGHLGLTPQTAGQLGGYRVQGQELETARRIFSDARLLTDAGIFALVLECVPAPLAAVITEEIAVPTIGIGAGPACDGQVLVTNDMLGLFERFTPRFVKQYANLAPVVKDAVQRYRQDIDTAAFPAPEHSFAAEIDFRALLVRDD